MHNIEETSKGGWRTSKDVVSYGPRAMVLKALRRLSESFVIGQVDGHDIVRSDCLKRATPDSGMTLLSS